MSNLQVGSKEHGRHVMDTISNIVTHAQAESGNLPPSCIIMAGQNYVFLGYVQSVDSPPGIKLPPGMQAGSPFHTTPIQLYSIRPDLPLTTLSI